MRNVWLGLPFGDHARPTRGARLSDRCSCFCRSRRRPNDSVTLGETLQSSWPNHETCQSVKWMSGSPWAIEKNEGVYPGTPASVRRYSSSGIVPTEPVGYVSAPTAKV